ncbi:MAG TPA: hypothetical protein DCZ92_09735 [Elusimicrobia bacterium]|nr:MAG: hypothetical protein A2016_10795 [Elusimicrobia bacterium GWF2_62_30]HBA61080.1 hypothetical protein [Elusimicrobiota bacterium]
MKISILALAVLITTSAGSVALAGGVEIDFDGTNKAGGAQTGTSQAKLLPSLEAAFAAGQPAIPAVPVPMKTLPDRGIPPASNPYCVAYCDGDSDGDSGSDGDDDTGSDNPSSGNSAMPAVSAEFLEKVLVAYVCIGKTEFSSDACMKKTGREAALALSLDMLKKVFTGNAKDVLTFHFPVPMTHILFAQSLYQAQMHGIDMLRAKLSEDNKKLLPLAWDSPSEKARKTRLMSENEKTIAKWKKDAILEAAQAANWKEVQAKIFLFNGGPAYTQLGSALLGKEVFTGQAGKLRAPQLPGAR